ncbi:MAG: cytochrome d ubiquinol oxidase subunit II [Alphaproteobacteria bacterium]
MMEPLIFLDYESLRMIWWALLGLLLIGFAVMDGFDLGVAALLPLVARGDPERRVLLATIEPVWEGNQVWLILGAGAIFAAWPILYATVFSGFYFAMLLVLLALILRPVGFGFRNKIEHPGWRLAWDCALVVSGVVPAIVFGVAFGNLFLGVPFQFDSSLRVTYTGTFFGLFHPFTILCGLLSLAMLVMHGAVYLGIKTEGPIHERSVMAAVYAGFAVIVLFAIGGLFIAYGIDGYVVTAGLAPDGPSNPLGKTVTTLREAWFGNFAGRDWEYHKQVYSGDFFGHGWNLAFPVIGFFGALLAPQLARHKAKKLAFTASSLSLFGIIATAGVSLFPFLLPSSSDPNSSLTVWDASSSQMTLFIMLIAAVVFLPVILAYTAFVFRVLRGPITQKQMKEHEANY